MIFILNLFEFMHLSANVCTYLISKFYTVIQRGDFGLERYEKREFQEKVRECFTSIRERETNDTGDKYKIPWHVIDARQSKEDLAIVIKELVEKIVEDTADKPLQKLWA